MDPRLHVDDPFTDPVLRAGAVRALRALINGTAVTCAAIVILQLLRSDPLLAWVPVALVGIISPFMHLPLRRDRVNGTALALAVVVLLGSIGSLLGYGTTRGMGITTSVIALGLAAIFVTRRALAVLWVVASLLMLGVIWAELGGHMRTLPLPKGYQHWLMFAAILGVFAMGMNYLRRALLDSVVIVRRELQSREAAQAALVENQRLLELALRATPAGVIVATLEDGRILAVNTAWERMFGKSREQAVGRTTFELGVWETAEARKRFAGELKRHGTLDHYPGRFVGVDGVFEATVAAEIINIDGQECAVTSFVNARDLLMARESLRRSEERFARTFQMVPIPMSITRCDDGLIIENNQAMRRASGLGPGDKLETTVEKAGHWVQPEERQRLMEIVRRDGHADGFETRFRMRTGEVIDVRIWSTIIDLDGEECLASALLNVSEQKRQEAVILSIAEGVATGVGEALFRNLTENLRRATNADVALVGEIKGDQVETVAMNRDGREWPPARYPVIGTACGAAVLQRGEALFVLSRDVATVFPSVEEILGERYDSYVGVCLRNAKGEPIGVLGAFWRDAFTPTEKDAALFHIFAARARAELMHRGDQRRILELNESLEGRVRTRTAQLESALAELESFSYSVSHDLRAPLRSINGYASIVLEEAGARLDDEHRRMLRRCVDSADRMGSLVDDLLDLAHVGRRPLHAASVDLSALAREVVDEIAAQEPDRVVDVTIEPGLMAKCDRGLIRTVLENLVRNAFKFTAKREHATIAFGAEPGPVYYVRDNGVGFDPAHAATLFKPFHRLHTDAEYGGTGIGLAIVARVIQRHGGTVSADAVPDGGATLRFTLGQPVGHGTMVLPARPELALGD